MIFNLADYVVKQEQYRDQVREAEKRHLIRLAVDDCERSATWQAIKTLVLGITTRQPTRDQIPCRDMTLLAEKAA
jgi:hypothetical protein